MEGTEERPANQHRYACCYCQTGKEKSLAARLNERYPEMRASVAEKLSRRRQHGEWVDQKKLLFSSYVFLSFPSGELPKELFKEGLRFLKTDGEWPLQGQDEEFARKLFASDGVLGYSKACFEGDRIRILSGPLMDYQGKILRVDRRFRNCEVSITMGNREVRVWLGYETVGPEND